MLWFLCSLFWQRTFLCACNRPNSWWCLTTWRLDCSGLYPDSLMCPSCPQSPCFAFCLIAASACWLCSSTYRQSYLLKPTTKGVCVLSLLPFSDPLKVASQFGSKTLGVPLAGRQYGEPACRRWAPFLACFEWSCSWCRLMIWAMTSCRSSDRSCPCCCSMFHFTANCWPTPICCKRSYSTSR